MKSRRILQQHVELNAFFAGDFTVRAKCHCQSEMAASASGAELSRPAVLSASDLFAGPSRSEVAEFSTLEQIAQAVRQCRKCPLGALRTNAVPGQGNPRAELVFIGEGPGEDEDLQGLAFVGRAGKLLTDIITAMGLTRQQVFIGNIIKCRPPGNRDPKPEEIHQCKPYLIRQLELIQPKVIVALGAHAARTLLDTDKPIGQLRGVFHECRYSPAAPPAKVMPTYHPAYLLRSYTPENRRRVWEDMKQVLQLLGLPIPQKGGKSS